MALETTHANVLRDGETEIEIEAKVPSKVDTKEAVDHLLKATRKLLKRHGIKDL